MESWIALGVFILINVGGWGYTIGKLNGRIKAQEKTTDRHEKVLNEDGLVQKLSACESNLANLDGSVRTYIRLTSRKLGVSEDEQI